MNGFVSNRVAATQFPRKVELDIDLTALRKVSPRHNKRQRFPRHEFSTKYHIAVGSFVALAISQFNDIGNLTSGDRRIIVRVVVNRPTSVVVQKKSGTLRGICALGFLYEVFEC